MHWKSPIASPAVQLIVVALLVATARKTLAQTTTWEGKYSTEQIALTVAYFVPSDRQPLPDWRQRVDYYCGRIDRFHRREFNGQSNLKISVHPEPIVSKYSTDRLRLGDQNAIYRRTIDEVDRRLNFAEDSEHAFPILLVLSEINWRALDDFFRLKPEENGSLKFEGVLRNGQHFPGSIRGGARASYNARRGVGRGLVSADGWRVPYRGSDCVVYHEGLGHTVGLPHPDPPNDSVMGLAQYRGRLSESFLNKDQKVRLGWKPPATNDQSESLFTGLTVQVEPAQPRPGQPVALQMDWPSQESVRSMRVRYQTRLTAPWTEVAVPTQGLISKKISLGAFDRPTPVSFRIDVATDRSKEELWGYFQVRGETGLPPLPFVRSADLKHDSIESVNSANQVERLPENEVDLIALTDPKSQFKTGKWEHNDGVLLSPKQFGARFEFPYEPPAEYRLTAIVQPIDEPGSLILGSRMGPNRFVCLLNHDVRGRPSSALENVNGRNVGNDTTYHGTVLKKNRLSQVVITVQKDSVGVQVDGRTIIDWNGDPSELSLSDYWVTPNVSALFVGAYNCRFRFHRITVEEFPSRSPMRQ